MGKTTIQVSNQTKLLLDLLKEKGKHESYDAALRELLPTVLDMPQSLAGAFPELGEWSKRDRMQFRTDCVTDDD